MLKIIRLLLFCLILDAYYDGTLADPWEPDKSWFTSAAQNSTNDSSQAQPTLSDDSIFNKPQAYAKIIHLIRQIKLMVKNNQIETAKRRKDESKSSVNKPAVAIHSVSKLPETNDVMNKVNNEHRRVVMKKVKQLTSDMRNEHILREESDHSKDLLSNKDETRHWVEKDRIDKPWTTRAEMDRNARRRKLISFLGKTPKTKSKTPKKKVETPSVDKDDLNEDKEKIEKEILNNEKSSQEEGKITYLSGLVNKLRKIAELGASNKKTPRFPTEEGEQNEDKPRDLLKDQAAWIGLAAGGCLAIFACALCFLIAALIKTFRRKRDERPLDLNFNCPPESYKKSHHPAFTHMHDPKTGRRYIVLMDDSTNYSITSSDSSSEEEIYNASHQSPVVNKPVLDCSHRSSINRTSTPIKSPLRLTRSAPGSPSVRRNLSKSWSSPPVSPLASVTPVFASPIKLPG